MLIDTKWSLGDTIFFLHRSAICFSEITSIECFVSDKIVSVVYVVAIPTGNVSQNFIVQDEMAFSSKEDLLVSLTDKFNKQLESGSA